MSLGARLLLRLIDQFAHQSVEFLNRGNDGADEITERLPL